MLGLFLYYKLVWEPSVDQVTHSYSHRIPALGLKITILAIFPFSSQPTQLRIQANNISVVLPSSSIKIGGKSVKWFPSYDRTNK